MGRLYVVKDYSDVNTIITANLQELKNQVDEIKGSLSSFNGEANKRLRGNALAIIKNRLIMYEDAFEYYSNVLNLCIEKVNDLNKKMIGLFGSLGIEGSISDEKIDEIREALDDATRKLNAQKAKCKKMEEEGLTDSEEYTKSKAQARVYEAVLGNVQSILDAIEEKIDEISKEDASCAGALGDATDGRIKLLESFLESEGVTLIKPGTDGGTGEGTSQEGETSTESETSDESSEYENEDDTSSVDEPTSDENQEGETSSESETSSETSDESNEEENKDDTSSVDEPTSDETQEGSTSSETSSPQSEETVEVTVDDNYGNSYTTTIPAGETSSTQEASETASDGDHVNSNGGNPREFIADTLSALDRLKNQSEAKIREEIARQNPFGNAQVSNNDATTSSSIADDV
jgi:hypothetical protein